jgi:hypothetical protein
LAASYARSPTIRQALKTTTRAEATALVSFPLGKKLPKFRAILPEFSPGSPREKQCTH